MDARIVIDEIIDRYFFRGEEVDHVELNFSVRNAGSLQIATDISGKFRKGQSTFSTHLRAASTAEEETSVPSVSRPRMAAIATASYP